MLLNPTVLNVKSVYWIVLCRT